MKGARIVVSLIVLAVLGFFAYRELARDAAEGVKQGADIIFPYNSYRVAELTIDLEGTTATIAREGGDWRVTSGASDVRPDFTADLIASWTRVRFMEVLKENPTPEELKLYKLDPPVATLSATIRAENGQVAPARPPRLEVGGALPLTPGFYGRVDGFPRVVALSPEAAAITLGVGREIMGQPSRLVDPREQR